MKTLVQFIDGNGITTEIKVIYKKFSKRYRAWHFIDESEEEFTINKEMIISMKEIKEEEE